MPWHDKGGDVGSPFDADVACVARDLNSLSPLVDYFPSFLFCIDPKDKCRLERLRVANDIPIMSC